MKEGERPGVRPHEITWDDLVRVGPGTSGGNYLRRFWWPVALSDEVKDIPVPVKVLGEELVLFRELAGHLALLGRYCSHRRASLEYGRIEEQGIRCAYHGWAYDRRGRVLDRPAEPIRAAPQIQHPWYPVRELGGLVFAYLGPDKESPPPLPRYDVLVQDGYRVAERGDAEVGKTYNCNWLQAVENTADTTHLALLHGFYTRIPIFKACEEEYGVRIYVLAPGSKPETVQLTKRYCVLPALNRLTGSVVGSRKLPLQTAAWVVPVDDTHCEELRITLYPQRPEDHGAQVEKAREREKQPHDRRLYGDIKGHAALEDKAMVESQGPIVDRSLEHLGYSDRGVMLLRKMIREGMADVANGKKPKGVLEGEVEMIDLDIGRREVEVGELPQEVRDLLPQLQAAR
jgi:nitrite reductase/ring-hydroxylating ferredoxin subunit